MQRLSLRFAILREAMDPIQVEQFIEETKEMSDRELLVNVYVRLRMVDTFVESARNNPMFAAMMQ